MFLGILGTNVPDKFSDWRLLDGSLATSSQSFLSQYVLAGPDSCKDPSFTGRETTNEPTPCEPVNCRKIYSGEWASMNGVFRCINQDTSNDVDTLLVSAYI